MKQQQDRKAGRRARPPRSASRRPRLEQLEERLPLSGLSDSTIPATWAEPAPALDWFQPVGTAAAEKATALELNAPDDSRVLRSDADSGRWLVQLSKEAIGSLDSLAGASALLNTPDVSFGIARGLGMPGQLLVDSPYDESSVESALFSNQNVDFHSRDSVVNGQAVPDDPEFAAGTMIGLHNLGQFGGADDADIDAPEAWDLTVGDPGIVVGVIDSGIDPTHPDLYLNVWLNRGEIPSSLLPVLTDVDDDSLITFRDLNDCDSTGPAHCDFAGGPNAAWLTDFNGNGYIDAIDLLEDPRWSDGVDTDGNGFIDDFFGWNFRRSDDEPFAPNNPSDTFGHGTHVAGTIGGIGDNGVGVAGVTWRTSIMSLKFLDETNQGQTSDAVLALNYATMMRRTRDVNLKVTNNSWGQSGGFNATLNAAIAAAGEAGILFVAAAGNGNILGRGIDNDRGPFYPASYELDNVVSVAASDAADEIARFSNFGASSVDVAAPGVGILSTLPGGRYGTANGTSMAAPHVTGTAALIWSAMPAAPLSEVRDALLAGADPVAAMRDRVAGGRLNAAGALNFEGFSPTATLVSAEDVTIGGAGNHEIVVRYSHRGGIDPTRLGDGDVLVSRQWGPRDEIRATIVPGSVTPSPDGADVEATYRIDVPGGTWDSLDYGEYRVRIAADEVYSSSSPPLAIPARDIGSFHVRIPDPLVYHVDTFDDSVDAAPGDGECLDAIGRCSLRAAVQEANSAPSSEPRTVLLDSGNYRVSIPGEPDSASAFPVPDATTGCTSGTPREGDWSNESTGDLDVLGSLIILGGATDGTVINGQGLHRVFKVHPDSRLELRRLTVGGGLAPAGQGGGGILTAGSLTLDLVTVSGNATSASETIVGGGGIAVWGGEATIHRSTITGNVSDVGGGVFVCNGATVTATSSTFVDNEAGAGDELGTSRPGRAGGGGIASIRGGTVTARNSTFSGNSAVKLSGAAVFRTGFGLLSGDLAELSTSDDGRFVAFDSERDDLVTGDTNGRNDVFVFDRQSGTVQRVSVAGDGAQADGFSTHASISDDGRYVAFQSHATNLVPGDTNGAEDVFVFDRQTGTVERVGGTGGEMEANGAVTRPAISGDGRFVAFQSVATNLVAHDTNGAEDVFVVDRQTGAVERVSVGAVSGEGNGPSTRPSISDDGRFVAFQSGASNLVPGDTNAVDDVFVFDRQTGSVERISVGGNAAQANGGSRDPSISGNGGFVAFLSDASNLISDHNSTTDVFIRDLQERITRQASGAFEPNGPSEAPSISDDGRYVAFRSVASNLVPGDSNSSADVFVFDRERVSEIELGSVGRDDMPASGASFRPAISGDGQWVAFPSDAFNLVTDDRNESSDVFLYERQSRSLTAAFPIGPDGGKIELDHVTASLNVGVSAVEGDSTIHSSLFAGNATAGDVVGGESRGHNIVARSAIPLLATDRVEILAPGDVGPLELPWGPTAVHPLRYGSAAIDGADPNDFLSTDQIGTARPVLGSGFPPLPDIGAFEAAVGEVGGTVFVDRDGDGVRDEDEVGLPNVPLRLDASGQPSAASPSTSTAHESAEGIGVGTYMFARVEPGDHSLQVQPPTNWTVSRPGGLLRVTSDPNRVFDANLYNASTSFDGRFIAFEAEAADLVLDDTNDEPDVFVFDRRSGTIQRVNVSDDRIEANAWSGYPSISGDGRFVAVVSAADNLVDEDTNGDADVFLFDRRKGTIRRVSMNTDGSQTSVSSDAPSISGDGRFVAYRLGSNIHVFDAQTEATERISFAHDGGPVNGGSGEPSISGDGRYVAFESSASNLVPDDMNSQTDIFVHDRETGLTTLASVADDRTQGNAHSFGPSISDNGRFVAFYSSASTLESGDGNGQTDVFVFDRESETTRRVSIGHDGGESDGFSYLPSISGDGRFVAFSSGATNLVTNDTNEEFDVFVFDRQTETARLASVMGDTLQTTAYSDAPSISGDGRFVAFESATTNFFPNDNSNLDVFVHSNPFASAARRTVVLHPGETQVVDFGVVPDPGEIRGRVYEEVVANGSFDAGEPPLSGWTVFLDLDDDRLLDAGEPSTVTGADGGYAFVDQAGHAEYAVSLVPRQDWVSVTPAQQDGGVWRVFLPAGGLVADREFGLARAGTDGQFENARISGVVFSDTDGDAVRDDGERGIGGVTVFLDLNDDRVRQFDEPRTLTRADDPATPGIDESGTYTFSGLGDRPYTVRLVPDERYAQSSPVGNAFDEQSFSLGGFSTLQTAPQAVVTGDLDGDSLTDVIVAHRNQLSVFPNSEEGIREPVIVELAPDGIGPIDLATGFFNPGPRLDLVVINHLNLTAIVLLDFDGAAFARRQVLPVGWLPRSVAIGDFDQRDGTDIVIANEGSGNLTLLRNDGNGIFRVDASPVPVGSAPFDVVAGHFNDDEHLDLAVANFIAAGNDFGNVSVLLNDGTGGFSDRTDYVVGIGPRDLVVADFDEDGNQDLAVANFLSNNISILKGEGGADGSFVTTQTLATGDGPAIVRTGDIDNDGDLDLLASNFASVEVSVFRNRFRQGMTGFEPAKDVGLARFRSEAVLSLATGHVDDDARVDLVLTNGRTNDLTVLRNRFVAGAHRIVLTGIESVSGMDFCLQPTNHPPTIDFIPDPPPVDEDSGERTITLTGITDGDDGSQALSISAFSDNVSLLPDPVVSYSTPAPFGTVSFAPAPDAFGTATITVTVTDAGGDGIAGNGDDATATRTFRVLVRPVNDPPSLEPDVFSVDGDTVANALDVLANDRTLPDVDEQLVILDVDPVGATQGQMRIAEDGSHLLYTPAAGFSGSEEYEYTASDGKLPLATARVRIDVRDTIPPTMSRIVVNSGIADPADLPVGPQSTSWSRQRSTLRGLEIVFSEPILAGHEHFQWINLGVNAPDDEDSIVELSAEDVMVAGNTAILRFGSGEQLSDGVYQLRIASTVTDLSGNPFDGDGDGVGHDELVVTGDADNALYQLTSDFDGDQGVSIFDFSPIAYWFGSGVPRAPQYMDLNDDGGISIFDFTEFALLFGSSVTFP